ncbi:hypothetical protein [Streptomyces erythrochromogenes]|uniref:hypothetical protein n=1 Tax=Streptomyces erythrochromogenes TaxID=285574 RepID=UPI0038641239|nr:hypothetical protein OG364_00575 [Streptomyces erythrochromogenes]WST98429.1 hypothetical protein OG364_40960 [Streptomyces erythrochromogenes]
MKPLKALIVLGVCLALLGAAGTWLFSRATAAQPCNGLPEDQRIQRSVGATVRPGMSCETLGKAIIEASVGSAGRHTEAQAQALKDVLFALRSGEGKRLTLDPALRTPLATALADYAPDLHAMLGGNGSTEYVTKAAPQTPPWESGGTHHLAVFTDTLKGVLQAVAQDPQAYAMLRMAETRSAAQRLAAVPADAKGYALTVPPTEIARALGTLDGIANAVTHEQGANRSQSWRATVVDALLSDPTTAAVEQDPVAGGPTALWIQGLKKTPDTERYDRLRTQAVDMARAWTQERKTEAQAQQGLLADVERTALSASSEIKS